MPRTLDWRRFPATSLPSGEAVFRISQRFNADGSARSPWFFSSTGSAWSGRFDLPPPSGTCYFSDAKHGAFLEVFREVGAIDRVDLLRRQVVTALRTGPVLRLANLRAAAAARYGVTADLSAGDDYRGSQEVASRLAPSGYQGISGTVRHDPSLGARTVALFGRGGPARFQRGWATTRAGIEDDHELLQAVRAFGYMVLDVPFDVPVTQVP